MKKGIKFLVFALSIAALILVLYWVIAIRNVPFIGSPHTTNVSGIVQNRLGEPVVNATVTLWCGGKIANVPNNPQYTTNGWNGSEYNPWRVGIFQFPNVPNVAYSITCEKDGYSGETLWDPQNPIPIPVWMSDPGVNISEIKEKYDNVSDSDIAEAKAIAFGNQSVQKLLNGTDYSIEYVCKASDENTPLILKISILIGSYDWIEGDVTVNSYLTISVDLTSNRVISIKPSYGGGLGMGWTREIPPGSYTNCTIKVNDVNGTDQKREVNLSLTCKNGVAVRPMILDVPEFEKFRKGEPYQVSMYGDQVVSSGWSGNFTALPNHEYRYVIENENSSKAAKVSSDIDLNVRIPVFNGELAIDSGPVLYRGGDGN